MREGRIDPAAYKYVFVASLAGAAMGVLVMWNRRRSQSAGASFWRQQAVLLSGTAMTLIAAVGFIKAFIECPRVQAGLVVILVTAWVAVVQSATRLPLPALLANVRAREFAFLKAPWTGVRLFGVFLRCTPIRFLGGPVFLARLGRDPRALLPGLRDAEAVHFWALFFSIPWLLFWAARGAWGSILVACAVHLPLNLYPVLHLRYVSWRVRRAVQSTRSRRHLSPTGQRPNTLSGHEFSGRTESQS